MSELDPQGGSPVEAQHRLPVGGAGRVVPGRSGAAPDARPARAGSGQKPAGEDDFSVHGLLPAIRLALRGSPPTPLGLTISASGMAISDFAFNLRHDLEPLDAAFLALAAAAVLSILAIGGLERANRIPTDPGVRPFLIAAMFALGGVVRTTILVLGNPFPSWSLWWQQLVPRVGDAMVWICVAAALVEWMDRAAVQRMRLDTAYRQLVATRTTTAAALAATAAELAAVIDSTRRAITEISDRLHARISGPELDACVERLDELVDREVRPSSHDLEHKAVDVRPELVVPLWPATFVRIGAMMRRWPRARPFQPEMAGLAAAPLVVVELVAIPAGVRGVTALHAVTWLSMQLAFLFCAMVFLTPLLRRMPWRPAIVITFATYVGLYVLGSVVLARDADAGIETPLAATVFPLVFALVAGGSSAASAQHRAESAAATRVVALTGRSLSRARQQLWAERHRLALALRGRVQANLTAASLLLRQARDEVAAGGEVDAQMVEHVRDAMQLAWRVDRRSPGAARQRLSGVTGVWSGIVDVDLVLGEEAEARLDADPDSADACIEVVREILLNAARHSGATSAVVSIRMAGSDQLRIRMRETGAVAPAEQAPGAGLDDSVLDVVSSRWWVHHEGAERVTTLVLPTGSAHSGSGDTP